MSCAKKKQSSNTITALHDKALAHKLVSLGLNKATASLLTGYHSSVFESSYVPPKWDHRAKMGWLNQSGADKAMADRIIRIVDKVYEGNYIRAVDPIQLIEFYETYMLLHPRDEMTINRIYYTLGHLYERQLSVTGCPDCGKPMVYLDVKMHQHCGICENKEQREKIAMRRRRALTKVA
ncbi:MAG: hypothetical protein GJ680_07350 [Alteromonadaceae bacterium]|nr:hypothetical protein [Alteromonadaceae bacterium]